MFFLIRSVLSKTSTIQNQYFTQANTSYFKQWIPKPGVESYELIIRYCNIHDSKITTPAREYGGVIAVTSSTNSFTVNIYGNNFTNVIVDGDGAYGGCIYLNAASIGSSWTYIYGNNFIGCSSSVMGSCVYLQSIGVAEVNNNTFSESTAQWGVAAYVKCTSVTSNFNYWNNLTSSNGYIYYQNIKDKKCSLLVQYSCFIEHLLITHKCEYTENDKIPSIQILYADVKETGDIQTAVSVKGSPVPVTINGVSFNESHCYRIVPAPTPTPSAEPTPGQTPEPTAKPVTPAQTDKPKTPAQTVIPAETPKPTVIEAAKAATAEKSKTGMIVGIVIACLIVLAIIILLIVFFAKRDTRTAYNNNDVDDGVDGFAVY